MNIFALDQDPIIAAQYNCDVHCNKILLECCQMLANCFSLEKLEFAPKTKDGKTRKHCHYNHPVSKFVRSSKENANWVIQHAEELEKQRLIIGYRPHFSMGFLKWAKENQEEMDIPNGELTDFAVAINDKQQCRKVSDFDSLSAVGKYRLYYKVDKKFAKWTNRPVPYWFK